MCVYTGGRERIEMCCCASLAPWSWAKLPFSLTHTRQITRVQRKRPAHKSIWHNSCRTAGYLSSTFCLQGVLRLSVRTTSVTSFCPTRNCHESPWNYVSLGFIPTTLASCREIDHIIMNLLWSKWCESEKVYLDPGLLFSSNMEAKQLSVVFRKSDADMCWALGAQFNHCPHCPSPACSMHWWVMGKTSRGVCTLRHTTLIELSVTNWSCHNVGPACPEVRSRPLELLSL